MGGNFCVKKGGAKPAEASAPAEADVKAEADGGKKAKDDKKPKKAESAGISKAERDELESLKTKIIEKKSQLKEQGLSGGQCNKDPDVVAMVARMQELKIKEDPSLAEGDKAKLEAEIEEYRMKLQTEFKYTKKEISADP